MKKILCLMLCLGFIGTSNGCAFTGGSNEPVNVNRVSVFDLKEESCFVIRAVVHSYLQSNKITNENLKIVRDYLVLARLMVEDPKEVSFNTLRELLNKISDQETKDLAIFVLDSVESFASNMNFGEESEIRSYMIFCLNCAISEISLPE